MPATVSPIVNDPKRLAAVRRIVPLYRPPSTTFDRLTRLAAELLEAPVALLTLVEPDRQFFVSSYGLPDDIAQARQTPIEYSICQHVVTGGMPLIVPDAALDLRLDGNLAVVEMGVASYAGIPLKSPDHFAVGALCVLDFIPRDWTDDKLAVLADLAAIAMDELRLSVLDRQVTFEREWRAT
ncbi:MAG TPA: GAF domain-containing protein [Acidimicrobiales bacterium]|nr:GAF domain-containing protein [Acidimicrobiales bacterium]